ncbi:hypothetical protein V2J09_020677 [Rumex salicifolius]
MGFGIGYKYYSVCNFVFAMMLLPSFCYSQAFVCSRATYYGSPDCKGNPTGACGYGDYGTTVNDGNVAAVSRLYSGGVGCGACYQVRCKAPGLCTDDGVTVVATDHGAGDGTDFILSPKAYTRMAQSGLEPDLLAYGVVDIEFRRVPCTFSPGSNLVFRVHERSKYPHYLAVVPIYQAGLYDIISVEVWQEDCKEWRGMRKPYGAAWDMENPPKGALTLRMELSSSINGDCKWVNLPSAIPDNWCEASVYDTGVQLD